MKRHCLPVRAAALAVVLLGSSTGPARAQLPAPQTGATAEGRLWMDGFLGRYRVAAESRKQLPSAGGRIMWWLAPPAPGDATLRQRLASRIAVGAFVVSTPGDAGPLELRHFGVQSDLRPLARPVAGRLDPMVTLGVGSLRVVDRRAPAARALLVPPPPLLPEFPETADSPQAPWGADRSRGGLTIAPGLGARLLVLPGLIVRGDARQVLRAGALDRHGVELSAGLSWAR